MKSSTYLTWFRRLLLLGAVVAGTAASAAGAVSRPPDVRDAAAALHVTPQGLKADGLRWQGIAKVYEQIGQASMPDAIDRYASNHLYSQGVTASATESTLVSRPPDVQDAATALHVTSQGLKADGLRLQGIAQAYQQSGQTPIPDAFERYATAHPYGGLSSATESRLVSRPPDVQDAASGLNAVAEVGRPPDIADAVGEGPYIGTLQPRPATHVSQSQSFDWGDYAIGLGSGMGLILLLGGGLTIGRQRRHHVQTA